MKWSCAMRRCALVVLLATTAGCGALNGDSGVSGKTIRYQVDFLGVTEDARSDSAIRIAYATNDGEQEQRDVGLPWTKVVGTAKQGFTASVTAQFDGFGTVMCRILADDRLIQQRSSAQMPYPVVECRS